MMSRSFSHCSCGAKLRIVDVRYKTYGSTESVYRRKECAAGCGTKVSTLELPQDLVVKVLGQFKGERNRRPYRSKVPS